MHCPACQHAISEAAVACVHCGFTFAALDKFLGMAPLIDSTFLDKARVLTKGDRKLLSREVEHFERRFPQCSIIIATVEPPENVPLSGYVYWAFNRNQAGSALEKAGANLQIMIAIQPSAGRAAATIGYGLEPFILETHLREALTAGESELAEGRWAEGLRLILEKMSEIFTGVAESLPEALGFEQEALYSPDQLTTQPRHHAWSY